MGGLRIWHLLVTVVAAAMLFALVRFDGPNSCTPIAPIVAGSYLCAILGLCGARWRGRRAQTGLLLGLLLGPLGIIVACSNPVEE